MLETIFMYLTSALAGAIDKVLEIFLKQLGFNVTDILNYIDFFGKLYLVLQSVALGLIIAIAVVQLSKFFFGALSDTKDRPLQIAVRSMIAVAMVYWGNYFLQLIFDLCSYPMDVFFSMSVTKFDVANKLVTSGNGWGSAIIDPQALCLLLFVMVIILGISLFKVLIEAVERWLVLCVLTYTSPLIYATLASKATTDIFRKWISMVIGQCLLLWANVWMVKGMLAIFDAPGMEMHQVAFKIVLIMAFSRVAQRIDSYLQQLGIGAATTGGGLLGDMMAVGMAAMGGKGAKGAGKSVGGGILGRHVGKMQSAIANGDYMEGLKTGGLAGLAAVGAGKLGRNTGRAIGEVIRNKGSQISNAIDNSPLKNVPVTPTNLSNRAEAKKQDRLDANAKNEALGMSKAQQIMENGGTIDEAKAAALGAYVESNDSLMGRNSDGAVADRKAFGEKMDKQIPEMFENHAQSSAQAAMENSLQAGNDINTAAQAAMTAYNKAYGPNGANLDAQQSAAMLDQFTQNAKNAQNGSCRFGINNDGTIRNGFGEQVSAADMSNTSNDTLARMYAYSANKNNADSPSALSSMVDNPNAGQDGQPKQIESAGYQTFKDDLEERGPELADAMVDQGVVVEDENIARDVVCGSSAVEAFAANDDLQIVSMTMQSDTPIQDANGNTHEIESASFGNGSMSFNHRIEFQDGTEQVENVSVKTQKAFESMKPQEQAQYTRVASQNGPTYYTRVKRNPPEKLNLPENGSSSGNKNYNGGGKGRKHRKNQ